MNEINISLTPELTSFVQSKIASGYYADANEVVRDALRRMDSAEEMLYQMKLARLKEALAPGIAQAERGEFIEFSLDSMISDMDREFSSH